MPTGTRRPFISALVLVASGALLAGCFSIEATFTIGDDATADIDFVTLIDTSQLEEFAGLLGQDADELGTLGGSDLLDQLFEGDDPCGDIASSLTGYEVTTREIDEGDNVGVGCTASDVALSELNSLGDDSTFVIEQRDGTTRFSAELGGVFDDIGGGTGDPAENDEFADLLGIDVDDLLTVRFVVTAPGSLGVNNASSTSGSTATWDIKSDSEFVTDGNATMTAEWTPGGGGGGGSTTWIILAIVAAVAAAIAAAVLVMRSKRKPSEAPREDLDRPQLAADPTTAVPVGPSTPPPPLSTPPPPPPAPSDPVPPPPSTPPPPPPSTPPPPPPY